MTTNASELADMSVEGDEPPRPTYAPAGMAMGCAMLTWGLLTHWSLSLAGGFLIACALWIWLRDVAIEWSDAK